MIDVVSEIVIRKPRHEVAAFAADPDNAPVWYAKIDSVEWVTSRPLRVGARIAFIARFLWRQLAYTYEIVEYVPAQRLVMRTAEGPFPMETTYEWTDTSASETRMTLRNRGSPAGFSRLLTPFLRIAVRSANRKDLALLRSILEGS